MRSVGSRRSTEISGVAVVPTGPFPSSAGYGNLTPPGAVPALGGTGGHASLSQLTPPPVAAGVGATTVAGPQARGVGRGTLVVLGVAAALVSAAVVVVVALGGRGEAADGATVQGSAAGEKPGAPAAASTTHGPGASAETNGGRGEPSVAVDEKPAVDGTASPIQTTTASSATAQTTVVAPTSAKPRPTVPRPVTPGPGDEIF